MKKNRLIFVKEFWNILEFISWKISENNNISNAVENDKWDNETLIQEYEQPKDQAYENIFFYTKNHFQLPFKRSGKHFIDDLTNLIDIPVSSSPSKSIVSKTVILVPYLN